MDKTLWAIKYARENHVPCFGTCSGFQHLVIEYARNVLGFRDAQHAEYDPYASNLFISQLACSLAGCEMSLTFTPGSQIADIYESLSATEQYYCNFGVNPDRIGLLKNGPIKITGSDSEGEIRVIELPGHPFFISASSDGDEFRIVGPLNLVGRQPEQLMDPIKYIELAFAKLAGEYLSRKTRSERTVRE